MFLACSHPIQLITVHRPLSAAESPHISTFPASSFNLHVCLLRHVCPLRLLPAPCPADPKNLEPDEHHEYTCQPERDPALLVQVPARKGRGEGGTKQFAVYVMVSRLEVFSLAAATRR